MTPLIQITEITKFGPDVFIFKGITFAKEVVTGTVSYNLNSRDTNAELTFPPKAA